MIFQVSASLVSPFVVVYCMHLTCKKSLFQYLKFDIITLKLLKFKVASKTYQFKFFGQFRFNRCIKAFVIDSQSPHEIGVMIQSVK